MRTPIRHFHLMSDGKTVREIDWDAWRKICEQDWKSSKSRLIIRVHSMSEFYARKGNQFVYVPMEQLVEVLKRCREQ